ncbi:hypothetical protein CSUI_006269 [Cystoisospora suis]|uniref:Transmembrane protein n=1 Tax=Cystoisospora suis TaxID=483139 RepID=A0A2C6KSC1_9APIC|nr:hypothetical protein CSUI_006269 [Cystoisospora suis]
MTCLAGAGWQPVYYLSLPLFLLFFSPIFQSPRHPVSLSRSYLSSKRRPTCS